MAQVKDPKEQVMLYYDKTGLDGSSNIPSVIKFSFDCKQYVMKPGDKEKVNREVVTHIENRRKRWEGNVANVKFTVKELVAREEEKPNMGGR